MNLAIAQEIKDALEAARQAVGTRPTPTDSALEKLALADQALLSEIAKTQDTIYLLQKEREMEEWWREAGFAFLRGVCFCLGIAAVPSAIFYLLTSGA